MSESKLPFSVLLARDAVNHTFDVDTWDGLNEEQQRDYIEIVEYALSHAQQSEDAPTILHDIPAVAVFMGEYLDEIDFCTVKSKELRAAYLTQAINHAFEKLGWRK